MENFLMEKLQKVEHQQLIYFIVQHQINIICCNMYNLILDKNIILSR